MKKLSMIGWLWLAITVGLLTAAPAHAFYNPSKGTWLNRDPLGEPGFELLRTPNPSVANGLSFNQCPSCKKRSALKVKMAINEANLYGFVQNAPIEQVDSLGLFATLDTSGLLGCKDHANEINNAWQAANAVIQQAIDNKILLSWNPDLLECMANSKTKIGISCSKCNLFRDFACGYNGNTANLNYATGTIWLCSSFFTSTPCQQAEILATEVSKLDCGVTDVDHQETKFAHWLNGQLCN